MDTKTKNLHAIATQLGISINRKTNAQLKREITDHWELDHQVSDATMEPTGFCLRTGEEDKLGILEFCSKANFVRRIDQHGNYSEHTVFGESTWAEQTEPPVIGTFHFFPVSPSIPIEIWHHGNLYRFYEPTLLPNVTYLVYFDGTSIKDYPLNGESSAAFIFERHASIALAQLLAPTSPVCCLFADERHGIRMDGSTHAYLHLTNGCVYRSGADINGLVEGQTTFTGLSSGVFNDEDITLNTEAQTELPFIYELSDGWHMTMPDNSVALLSEGTAQYNDVTSKTLQDITGSDHGLTHIIATNDPRTPYVKLVGQQSHANKQDAREDAREEVYRTAIENVPTNEFKPCYSLIHDSGGQLVNTDTEPALYIDFRRTVRSF